LSQPKQLPTAYAVADWIDPDGSKASAPAQAQALRRGAENLATARKIRDAIGVIEQSSFNQFWINVEASLRQLLGRSRVKGWVVDFERPKDSERGCINLRPAAEAVDTANMLQVSSENLTGPTNAHEAGFFGIWKGPANEDDPELSAELKREGFKTHKNWIGWKWYKTEGLPDFLRSRENVIQLNADNHTEDKPLAGAVAQILWQLFEAHRLRLEELNRRVNGIRF
jgi:hypothetical protein